jgi:hypothetical protein
MKTDRSLRERKHTARYERLILIALFAAMIVVALASTTIGRYSIPVSQLFTVIKERLWLGKVSDANAEAYLVMTVIRVPRILLTIFVGAALSASGASFQGLFKNPMVSPDILGVSSAAGAGAALGHTDRASLRRNNAYGVLFRRGHGSVGAAAGKGDWARKRSAFDYGAFRRGGVLDFSRAHVIGKVCRGYGQQAS